MNTAAGAWPKSGCPLPRQPARGADWNVYCSRRPASVCDAPGAATSAMVRSGPVTRQRAGRAFAVPNGKRRRLHARGAAKAPCPRCGKAGLIRVESGWCGTCSRPAPPKGPPRICRVCGELRRHSGLGMCSRCFQRDPDRPLVRAEHLIAELSDPPEWLQGFVVFLAARFSPSRATTMIAALGGLLTDGQSHHPQALLERARRPGRSMGSLARGLQDYFIEGHLAMPTDQDDRLAAGRRQRRVDAAPVSLRPAVQAFCDALIANRQRARTAATRPRSNSTIEAALAALRDLALFLHSQRSKSEWALVDVHDIEAFLAKLPKARNHRITVLRQFFRFARTRRIVLIDPTRDLAGKAPKGFIGTTLTLQQQRALFSRWTTDPTVHPHEALLGILALLHGASSLEVRMLRDGDIDFTNRTIRLGQRPGPVPLDPASWGILQRGLAHRVSQGTQNRHVVVTKGTKAGERPASTAYFSHILDPCGVPPRTVRCTRLAALVNTIDPKLVAAAFGMDTQGVMHYLADRVDDTRLPSIAANP